VIGLSSAVRMQSSSGHMTDDLEDKESITVPRVGSSLAERLGRDALEPASPRLVRGCESETRRCCILACIELERAARATL
jgi:hypothetical protein